MTTEFLVFFSRNLKFRSLGKNSKTEIILFPQAKGWALNFSCIKKTRKTVGIRKMNLSIITRFERNPYALSPVNPFTI